MKKGNFEKKHLLSDDETYLEGINLVTGDKIDYNRPLQSELEVNAMCISDGISRIDKFQQIIVHGENIQKWSLFQNLTLYTDCLQNAEKLLGLMEKNYCECGDLIAVMGEGVMQYLKKVDEKWSNFNMKCYESVYRLAYRSISNQKYQQENVLADWIEVVSILFGFKVSKELVESRKEKLSELHEFINGSFSMGTIPQRRKVALELILALIEQCQQVERQAHSKVLFFNNDLNAATRLVICNIVGKILKKNVELTDMWKCLFDYYYRDKNVMVRGRAFQIISQLYFEPNFQMILNELDQQKAESVEIIRSNLVNLLKTFSQKVFKNQKAYFKIISFINRIQRINAELHLKTIAETYNAVANMANEQKLMNDLPIKFQMDNPKILKWLIKLYHKISHIEHKERIKGMVLKGLRYHEYEIKDTDAVIEILQLLELGVEEDANVLISLLTKAIELSRWRQLDVMLMKVTQLRLLQSQYDRLEAVIMRLFGVCPYFLLTRLFTTCQHLFLTERKTLALFFRIKDKFMNSRCWCYRRNYILLYAHLRINTSLQFGKAIPLLNYKALINDKSVQLKMEFIRLVDQLYSYVDPTSEERVAIKDTVTKLVGEADRQLSVMSFEALGKLKLLDGCYDSMNDRITRNKLMQKREEEMQQVLPEAKKHIKTEKVISKEAKERQRKKGSMIQSAINKEIKVELKDSKGLLRCNSTQTKQTKMTVLKKPSRL